jgi:hypothetical protein
VELVELQQDNRVLVVLAVQTAFVEIVIINVVMVKVLVGLMVVVRLVQDIVKDILRVAVVLEQFVLYGDVR